MEKQQSLLHISAKNSLLIHIFVICLLLFSNLEVVFVVKDGLVIVAAQVKICIYKKIYLTE